MNPFRPRLPPKAKPKNLPPFVATAGDPVVLHASITALKPGQTSSVADASALENPKKTSILVDEVRFSLKGADAARELGYFVRTQLHLGRQRLFNDWCPLALLGTPIDRFQVAPIAGPTGNVDFLYTWRPPKPILVPYNAMLVPRFYYGNEMALGGGALPTSIDVTVTIVGRDIGSHSFGEAEVDLPWVAPWLGTADATGTDSTQQSQASHLVNPFPVPITVHSMLGGVFVATADVDTELQLSTSYLDDQSEWVKVQLVDHQDRILIRDQIPMADAFGILDNTWRVKQATLEPNGFYLAFLSLAGSSALASYQLQPAIVMVGNRKVPFFNGGFEGEAF